MALKLFSLNIERCNHLARNVPAIEQEQPDVLCLQEVFRADFENFKIHFGMNGVFLPYVLIDLPCSRTGRPDESGIAILSKHPLVDTGAEYYYRPDSSEIFLENVGNKQSTNAYGIVWGTVLAPDNSYRIATTHFTWTHDGETDDHQRRDFGVLSPILESLGEHVLCGDLNAPRGGEMWDSFQSKYHKDNIPADLKSSLDTTLHRSADIRNGVVHRMVDCLFTTSQYEASRVRIIDGVSDHKAVVADISKGN